MIHALPQNGAAMKKTPGTTAANRGAYWKGIIEEARRYPAGITAYCKDRGISHDNYYFWFKKLRPDHPEWEDLGKDSSRAAQRARVKRKNDARRDTEVVERPRRRRFTGAEKARILRECEAASSGQIVGILRREGIYASHIQKWRTERDEAALAPKKRGPKPNVEAAKIKILEQKMMRLEKKLAEANALIRLQKKVAEIMTMSFPESEETD